MLTRRLRKIPLGDWASIALLGILAILFLWRIVFLGHILAPVDLLYTIEPWGSELPGTLQDPVWNPIPSDVVLQYVPMAIFVREALQRGEIAFWNPYLLSGTPVLAMGSWLVLYPVANLLWLFLPAAQTLSWLAVVHLFLAGLFMFLLLRELELRWFGSLVGALAFAFNGYMVAWLANVAHPASMIWLPLVVWGIERALRREDWRWVLVSAFAFAFQILGGNPVRALHAGTVVALLMLFQTGLLLWSKGAGVWQAARPLRYGALALVLGFALAAPQILPTLELYSLGIRTGVILVPVVPIMSIIRLVAPDFFGNPIDANYSIQTANFAETHIYFGILPLAFVVTSLFSPRRQLAWFFVGMGVLGLLLTYGIPPFYQVFSLLYPTFRSVFPGRFLYISAFAWAVAAGLGADWVVSKKPVEFLRRFNVILIGIAIVILLWGSLLLIKEKYQLRFFWQFVQSSAALTSTAETSTVYRGASLLTALIFVSASAFLLHNWTSGRITESIFVALGTILVVGDLFLAGIDYLPAFDPALLYPATPSLEFLQTLEEKDPQPHRVLPIRYEWPSVLLPEDSAGVYHLSGVQGRSSWMLNRYARYMNLTGYRHTTNSAPVSIEFKGYDSGLLDALNSKYIYIPPYVPWEYDLMPTIHNEQPAVPGAIATTTWTIDGDTRNVFYAHPTSAFDLFHGSLPQGPLYLKTAIAMQPESWDREGDGVQFEIYMQPGDGQARELLFSRYIDPKHNSTERHWIPVEIDVSRYGADLTSGFIQSVGEKESFTFVTQPGPANDSHYDWAGWAEPMLVGQDSLDTSELELLYDGPNKVYYNKDALPRAWVVHRVTQVPQNQIEAVEARLVADDFNPAVEAIVEGVLPGSLVEATDGDQVKITSYTAHRIEIEAELSQPGVLVLSDLFYPGWKAHIDGVEQVIYPTNLIMRGVFLEAGRHQVIFQYKPSLFITGLYISGVSMLLMLAALTVRQLRRRHY